MTDAVSIEERVLPIPPAPVAIAEVEAMPPQAASVDGLAPAPDQGVAAPTELPPAVDEVSSEVPSAEVLAERALPFDVEHLGVLRRAVLDHLVDTEGPQNVAQILAAMPPGTTRGSGESAIRREWEAGRVERVGAGLYVLAKPKPPKSPKRQSASPPPTPTEEAIWLEALEAWAVDPASWNVEAFGPAQNVPNQIPSEIKSKFNDRLRKRAERRREADAAAAKRSAADRDLRDKLIAVTGGNIIRSSALDDVAPIKLAMQVVPLDRILYAIRCKVDKKMYPGNEPATSWSEPRLLKAIAEDYARSVLVPSMIAAWTAAGTAPATTTRASSLPPADQMPDDIDELRRHHDNPHAPPGPHNLPKPDAARPALDMSQKPADALEALPRPSMRHGGLTRPRATPV
jgi:hypothetical protein